MIEIGDGAVEGDLFVDNINTKGDEYKTLGIFIELKARKD